VTIPNQPSWIKELGLTPPVEVTIECDGKTKQLEYYPMGETKTIRFGERSKVMIDGAGTVRGFGVRVRRPGYKDWAAEYPDQCHLMRRRDDANEFVRLDSILLMPAESADPSIRMIGGPGPTTELRLKDRGRAR
jgi:hypothetical protein